MGGVREERSEALKYHTELVMDRGVWKLAIHTPEPLLGFEILWISALPYPTYLGLNALLLYLLPWS